MKVRNLIRTLEIVKSIDPNANISNGIQDLICIHLTKGKTFTADDLATLAYYGWVSSGDDSVINTFSKGSHTVERVKQFIDQ